MFTRATYDRENTTVHYYDADGNETLYIGGSFAWRTNNPGNLTKPSSYVMEGAIGYAQRTSTSKIPFVIFSDRDAGHRAHQHVVKRIYGDSTVAGMITRYAPAKENDTEAYIDQVTSWANVSARDVVGQLSSEKFEALSAAMERKEGYVPGVIKSLGKSVQVTVLDHFHNALSNQEVHIKAADKTIVTKTDKHGALPSLPMGLIADDVSLYFAREKDDIEHIGDIVVSGLKEFYTFVSPYFLVSARARIHEKDLKTRPSVHIVRPNETLTGIATRYGTTVAALVRENGLSSPDRIHVRQHLKIPATSTSQTQSIAPHSDSKTLPKARDKSSPSEGPPHAISKDSIGRQQATDNKASSNTSIGQASQTEKPPSDGGTTHQRNQNGHPETVVSSAALELSGAQWCGRFPGSNSLASLNAKFGPMATAFITALKSAGATVRINAALRPNERSYLMHYAFMIAKGAISPDKVGPYKNVNIDWIHRTPEGEVDILASKNAATEMCTGYGINPHSKKQKVARPGTSRHNFGAAVDLNISDFSKKKIKDASGDEVDVDNFDDLIAIGATYGVIYYSGEKMHWSDTGH